MNELVDEEKNKRNEGKINQCSCHQNGRKTEMKWTRKAKLVEWQKLAKRKLQEITWIVRGNVRRIKKMDGRHQKERVASINIIGYILMRTTDWNKL